LWCRSASGAWSFCSDVAEFKALVASLGRTDDEKRLKKVLVKLAPIFERSLGLTGVACSLCGAAPPNGQLLLCDGTDCAEEWCFACGGVTCVPDGDWRCRGCAPPSLAVASQKWAQCDACAKWRRPVRKSTSASGRSGGIIYYSGRLDAARECLASSHEAS
jgi:hypothetical protein